MNSRSSLHPSTMRLVCVGLLVASLGTSCTSSSDSNDRVDGSVDASFDAAVDAAIDVGIIDAAIDASDGTCRNGHLDVGEQCDDGDRIDWNGCTNACTLPVCGDGIRQHGEICDWFDYAGRWMCAPGCVENVCGDGIVKVGFEQCDDGNDVLTDVCSPWCMPTSCGNYHVDSTERPHEFHYSVVASAPNGPSSVVLRWNDDILATIPVTEPSTCPVSISGMVTIPREVFRAYRNLISIEVLGGVELARASYVVSIGDFGYFGKIVSVSVPQPAGSCLPTIRGPALFYAENYPLGQEECDEGPNSPTCHWCARPSCGDGVIQPERGETCEIHGAKDFACNYDCTESRCGDGWLLPGVERCDDGNDAAGDGCFACDFESCGNGVVDRYELCDDGNADDDDECIHCFPARCGDGFVRAGFEECDVPGDYVGCRSCQLPD